MHTQHTHTCWGLGWRCGELWGERDFPLTGSFPTGHNSQDWARLKPGAWNLLQISHVDTGVRGLTPSSTAFSSALPANGRWAAGTSTAAPTDARITGSSLAYCPMGFHFCASLLRKTPTAQSLEPSHFCPSFPGHLLWWDMGLPHVSLKH